MKNIELKSYGSVLTGRPWGAQAYADIKESIGEEIIQLDFSGVFSLGSSFGEEFVVPIAKRQNNEIQIKGANAPVRNCLALIATDFNIKISFI